MTRQATAAEQAATALQITALHDLAELLRRQLDDLRDDRDHWRGMAEAGQRLLAPPRIGGPIIASEINAAPRTHHPPHVPQTSRPAHGTRVSVRFRQPPRAFTPRAGRLARYCPQEP
jgi:hypothetical protein